MAHPVPSGTIVRASIVQSLFGPGEVIVNTLWFRASAAADIDDLTTGLLSDYVDPVRALQTDPLHYDAINVSSYPPPALYGSDIVISPSRHGTAGADTSISPATAWVATLETGLIGRKHRGRLFIAGCQESDYLNGSLNGTFAATAQTTFNTVLTDLAGIANWVWVVAHTRDKNPNWQPNPALTPYDRRRTLPAVTPEYNPVTQVLVRPVLRQQRRREIGVSHRGARGGPSHVP